MVLGAAEALHALTLGGAARVDVFRDRRGADEADGADVGIVEDGVDGFLVAVHHIEDAGGQARLDHELGEPHGHARIALGRLQDEGVAAGDRRRELPHRDHRREVERRDAGDDAERLAHGIEVDAGAGGIAELALHQVRDAAGELHHLEAALDVALGVGDDLAVLAGEELRELVVIALHELEELEQHPRPPLRVGGGPRRLRALRVLHRRPDLGLGGERHLPGHLAGHGLVDVAEAPGGPPDLLAADEMPDLPHCLPPGYFNRVFWRVVAVRHSVRRAATEGYSPGPFIC